MIATTSRAARRTVEDAGAVKAGVERVVNWLRSHPNEEFTRAEIARAIGMKLQTACARVRDELDSGDSRIRDGVSTRKCKVNGETAKTLQFIPNAAAPVPTPVGQSVPPPAASPPAQTLPVAAAPYEQLIYDSMGRPFYTAVGWGPGYPLDQEHLYRRKREKA